MSALKKVVASVVAGGLLVTGAGVVTGATATAPTPAAKAEALARAPIAAPGDGQAYRPGEDAKAAARTAMSDYPLPEGGSFNGIRWDEIDGGITLAEIKAHLQFNAACQWWRALANEEQTQATVEVVRAIPDWPMFRQQGPENDSRAIAAAAVAGKGREAVPPVLREACEAMVGRMQRYSAARGMRGPR